ncbi:hypothetical protein BH09PLA1_BH09PLA1_31680 [soil metagenome]
MRPSNWRRRFLIVLAIAVTLIVFVTTVWKTEIRTAIRDIRYSPSTPLPQTGLDAERFERLHRQILRRKTEGPIDVLFLCDSITEFWQSAAIRSIWDERFAPLGGANFGVSSDGTQHVLWRITDGKEIDGLAPRVVVLMVGTNNTPTNSARAIADGIERIVRTLRLKLPHSRVLLLSILPRERGGEEIAVKIRAVNQMIAGLHDGQWITFLDVTASFVDATGQPARERLSDGLHLSLNGYQTLADAIAPKLAELLHEPQLEVKR